MNEQKNYNGRGIFYGVIGVATLVVAIIGATFAYFTASKSDENTITGNMAKIEIGLSVTKVTDADKDSGLIPMSNSMVEVAVNTTGSNMGSSAICVDDAGNAVCQVYKAVVTNSSAAAVFVDGYVALMGGSGSPTDYTYMNATTGTTMRWAQVFCTESENKATHCTTAVDNFGSTLGTTQTIKFDSIDNAGVVTDSTAAEKAKNKVNIRDQYKTFGATFNTAAGAVIAEDAEKGVLTQGTINDNIYAVIGKNYIRVSDHKWATDGSLASTEIYTQGADVTSALVYNQQLAVKDNADNKDEQTYYFVVWLSETGTSQNPEVTSAPQDGFFSGQVKFLSAQGSEVSATFGGYTRVPATDNGDNTVTG